jgi:hypothetical protein
MKKFASFLMAILVILQIVMLSVNGFCMTVNNAEIHDGQVISTPDVEEPAVGSFNELNAGNIMLASNSISYSKYLGSKRYYGAVRYYVYACYKNTSNWYWMTGKNLTDTVYHSKGTGKKQLSFTKTQTFSSQYASDFSVSAGAQAEVGDMVKANVAFGTGITKTVGRLYSRSSTIAAEIPKSASTGYYKLQICHDFYRTKVIQTYTDGSNPVTRYISMPYGESYAAVLYSATNESGSWKRWKVL